MENLMNNHCIIDVEDVDIVHVDADNEVCLGFLDFNKLLFGIHFSNGNLTHFT